MAYEIQVEEMVRHSRETGRAWNKESKRNRCFMDAVYGSTKGNITRGTKMYDFRTGPATNYHYTDEVVENEAVGTGNGATALYTSNLGYTPVRPGTVRFTDGTQIVTDDGNGNLVGAVNAAGANTVNYATGAYNFTFAAVVANGTAITATYEYAEECAPCQRKLAA